MDEAKFNTNFLLIRITATFGDLKPYTKSLNISMTPLMSVCDVASQGSHRDPFSYAEAMIMETFIYTCSQSLFSLCNNQKFQSFV